MRHYSKSVQREQHRHRALLVYDGLLGVRYNNVSRELPYRDIMREIVARRVNQKFVDEITGDSDITFFIGL